MQLHYSELENGIRMIKLRGVLDLAGVGAVERKLKEHSAGERAQIILDLSEVTFLASIGIRLIVTTAKSIGSRGGRFVMSSPAQDVKEVLDVTGIGQVIPICADLDEAKSVLAA